jgi:hypothetical protein
MLVSSVSAYSCARWDLLGLLLLSEPIDVKVRLGYGSFDVLRA